MLARFLRQLTAQRLIGIDAGSAVIKVVELLRDHGRLMLVGCFLAEARDGSTAAVLQQLLARYDFTAAQVAIGLAAPELTVKAVHFPPMPKKELQNAIQLEAEQAILNGHTLNDTMVDWYPLTAENSGGVRGVLAVVPKTVMTTRLQPFDAVGLRPVVMDAEGLALWNAYWLLLGHREDAGNTILLANIGVQKTNLVIVKGRDQLILIRDLQVGSRAIEAGRGAEWVEEVRDSLVYARAKGGLRTLNAAYVTGGGSGPKLQPLLKAAVPAPVTLWDPLEQLECCRDSPSIDRKIGRLLPIAIGLALRWR